MADSPPLEPTAADALAPPGGAVPASGSDAGAPPDDVTIVKAKQALGETAPADADPAATTMPGTPPPKPGGKFGELMQGQRLGVFVLEDTLGVGGMATVLKARDTTLDRPVALKILPPEMACEPDNVLRFHNEARSAAKLDDEHIARVYSFGSDQGLHFIAFEYVEGETLRAQIDREGKLRPADALRIGLQIARGLAHAAARGVVHRDIKPSNILITPAGRAKLVDMGLARSQLLPADGGLTHSGVTLGTFDYISPEQALDPRQADCRSDLYSLGCTLYHALTGSTPVPQGTALRKMQAHQHEQPLDPRDLNPAVPAAVAQLLAKLMAKNPADRFQQPTELIRELEAMLPMLEAKSEPSGRAPTPAPAERPRLDWVLLLAAPLLLAAAVAVTLWLNPPPAPAPWLSVAPPRTPSASVPPPRLALREAADGTELARLVAAQPSGEILLTGSRYDLKEGLELTAGDLLLRAKGPTPPTLRLLPDEAAAAGGECVVGLRGGSLRLVGLRIEAPGSGRADAAVWMMGGQLACEDCVFLQPTERTAPSGGERRGSAACVAEGGTLEFRGSVFAGGDEGVRIGPGVRARLEGCVLGPHRRPLVVAAEPGSGGRTGAVELKLAHCLCVVEKGAIVLEARERVRLELQDSVFAPPTLASAPRTLLLFGQTDPALTELRGGGNAFCRLDALAAADSGIGPQPLARTLGELGAVLGQSDDRQSALEPKLPWREPDELMRLARLDPEALRAAVRLRDDLPSLRSGPTTMKGAERLLGQSLYAALEPLRSDTPAPLGAPPSGAGRELAVDGMGKLAGAFATLAEALAAGGGDEETVILLKVNGALPVRTEELGDRRVTLRAAPGFAPELVPHPDSLPNSNGEVALFRLADGSLTLEQLAIRLSASVRESPKLEALAAIAGQGKLRLRSCQATLQGDDDVKAALATIEEPGGMAALRPMGAAAPRSGAPGVEVADSLVRGRGDLALSRQNRPFVLEVRNSAIALQGSMLALDGVRRGELEPPLEPVLLQLDRVSAYFTDGLVWFRATPAASSHQQVRVESASDCLFASGEGQPLIRMEGPRNEAELKRRFAWKGKRNLYGATAPMLALQPMDRGDPPRQFDGDRWGDLWGRDDEQPRFRRGLRFAGGLEARAAFDEVSPAGLRPLATDVGDLDLQRFGADLDKVFSRDAAAPMNERR